MISAEILNSKELDKFITLLRQIEYFDLLIKEIENELEEDEFLNEVLLEKVLIWLNNHNSADDEEDEEDEEKEEKEDEEEEKKINEAMNALSYAISKFIRVADFGIAKLQTINTKNTNETLKFFKSEPYAPKNLMSALNAGDVNYFRYDVHMLGTLILTELSSKPVFYDYGDTQAALNSLKSKNISEPLCDLLSRCVSDIELDRPKDAIDFYNEMELIIKQLKKS